MFPPLHWKEQRKKTILPYVDQIKRDLAEKGKVILPSGGKYHYWCPITWSYDDHELLQELLAPLNLVFQPFYEEYEFMSEMEMYNPKWEQRVTSTGTYTHWIMKVKN